MKNVLREKELGLKDLFVGANVEGNFMDWFKGFKELKEAEKAETIGKLVENARSSLDIFQSCNAVYDEKQINVTLYEIPTVAEGRTFTNADTMKNIQYLDFISTICWCVTEEIDMRYINYKAYTEFNEEIHDEDEYWNEHCKFACTENEKYEVLESIAEMSFQDIEEHFISFYEEDLEQGRYFLKLDNEIEIVIDKLD